MKRALEIVSLMMLALVIAVSGFFVLPLCSEQNSSSHIHGDTCPIFLTAQITAPADGAVIQPGDCFEVTAAITAADMGCTKNIDHPLFSKTVHASPVCPIGNVSGTIAVTGSAMVEGSATKYASSGLRAPTDSSHESCPTEVTLSWQVCCTGPGAVTITLHPAVNIMWRIAALLSAALLPGQSLQYTLLPVLLYRPRI